MKTKFTELLGIKYPVIQGGMAWTSDANLAAAVSNAAGQVLLLPAGALLSGPEMRSARLKR